MIDLLTLSACLKEELALGPTTGVLALWQEGRSPGSRFRSGPARSLARLEWKTTIFQDVEDPRPVPTQSACSTRPLFIFMCFIDALVFQLESEVISMTIDKTAFHQTAENTLYFCII